MPPSHDRVLRVRVPLFFAHVPAPAFECAMTVCPPLPVCHVLRAQRWLLLSLLVLWAVPGCRRSGGSSSVARTVRLNEVMGRNASIEVADGSGSGVVQDWVEIHNPGAQAVNLTDFSLSDNENRPEKFVFPRGTLLGPRDFLVVFLVNRDRCEADCQQERTDCRLAAGEDSEALLECDLERDTCEVRCAPGGFVADFGLSASAPEGESVFLFDPEGDLVDRIGVLLPPQDVSNGRFPDSTGGIGLIYLPTPGSANKPVGLQPARYSPTAGSGTETRLSDTQPHELRYLVERDQVLDDAARAELGTLETFVEFADPPAGTPCPPTAAEQASLSYSVAPADLVEVEEAAEIRRDAAGQMVEATVLQLTYSALLPPVACGTVRFYRVVVDDPLRDGPEVVDRGCVVSCGTASVLVNEYQPRNTKIVFESVNSRGEPRAPSTPDWIELKNAGTESINNIGEYLLVGLGNCDDQDFDPSEHTLNALRGFTDSSGQLLPLEPLPAGGFLWILADRDENARRSYTLVGDPERRPFFSTQFRLDATTSNNPDGFCLLSPALVSIDRVVLDFRGSGVVFDQDQSVGRFPGIEGDAPNALQPGTVTDCPTPEGGNAVDCELRPSFEEVVLLQTESGARCPAVGEDVVVRGQVNIDQDTAEESFTVNVSANVAGSQVEALDLVVTLAEDQLAAKPAMTLYDFEARISAGQSGDLVTLVFAASDERLGGDPVVYDEATAETLFPGSDVSLRYVVGFVPPADAPVLSEVLPGNRTVLLPPFFGLETPRFPDYAEVYNPAESAVDLEGYYLASVTVLGDPIRRPRRFRLPAGSIVPAGGYLSVYFGPPPSAEPPLEPPEYIEVRGFDLACEREALLLVAPDAAALGANCVLDSIAWDLQTSFGCDDDVAVGRLCPDDVEATELVVATPGAPNLAPTLVHGSFHELLLEGSLNSCLEANAVAVRVSTVVFVDQSLLATLGSDSIIEAQYFVDFGSGEIPGIPTQVSTPRTLCVPGDAETCVEPPPGYGLARIAHPLGIVSPGLTYRLEFSDACGDFFEVGPFTLGSAETPHPDVLINELNRGAVLEGASEPATLVELYNASSEVVDLGGMFLSVNPFAPRQARLADGLSVGPLATVTLSLDELGLELAPRGRLELLDSLERGTCLVDAFDFDFAGLTADTSLGRVPDGAETIVALDAPTFGIVDSGEPPVGGIFIRGDATEDLRVNVLDMVRILDILFDEEPALPRCLDAADVNDDGRVNITDVGMAGNAVFGRGPPPPLPFPEPGLDPTPDDLPCPP